MQQAAATGYKFLILTNTLTEQTSNLCDQRWRQRRNHASTFSHVRRIPPMKKRHRTTTTTVAFHMSNRIYEFRERTPSLTRTHLERQLSIHIHWPSTDHRLISDTETCTFHAACGCQQLQQQHRRGRWRVCEPLGSNGYCHRPPWDTDLTASFVSDLCGASLCSTTKNKQQSKTNDAGPR